jgi:hypothetical protein
MPAPQPDFSRTYDAIRELLACPACHGELALSGERLTCVQCRRSYLVVDGIPVLIAEHAQTSPAP